MTIRVCPQRDAVCPHGMSCPYTKSRYECEPNPEVMKIPTYQEMLGSAKEAAALSKKWEPAQ